MALIRKSGRKSDLGNGKFAVPQQLFGAFDTPPHYVSVRCYALGILERARKMEERQPRYASKITQLNGFFEVGLHILQGAAVCVRANPDASMPSR